MHQCEFCNAMFKPRPQVKRPRACGNCQSKRQQQNEKLWQERNLQRYDPLYHRTRRQQRLALLRLKTKKLIECLRVGGHFFGLSFLNGVLDAAIEGVLIQLGIRRVNKFWITVTPAAAKVF